MMNKLIYIIFGISVLIFTVSCALFSSDCHYPDSSGTIAPVWVCSGSVKGLNITATGYAQKSSLGRAFMQQMAVADARTTLARLLAENNSKVIRHTSGTATITVKDLEQTSIVKSIHSPTGGLYVLVKFESLR
ncbi:MAG: hypothetical protein KAT90_07595 [Gammaproteobacteria bacterium]|nr:hypothetical protein [Gammaproteobacteria bacterium]